MYSIFLLLNRVVFTDGETVGYLPREIARPTKYLLDRGAVVIATLITDRYRRSPLFQGGLEISCSIKVTIAGTVKGHMLIGRYAEMVQKLYCEPKEEMIIGSFLERCPNPCVQPKKRKTKKATVPPKIRDIRAMLKNVSQIVQRINKENETIQNQTIEID